MSNARKICPACLRPEKFFEGCSMVECPNRKPLTAQPRGIGLIAHDGCTLALPVGSDDGVEDEREYSAR